MNVPFQTLYRRFRERYCFVQLPSPATVKVVQAELAVAYAPVMMRPLTEAVTATGNGQPATGVRANVIETLEPLTVPVTVPLGPETPVSAGPHVPVSDEPDWTSLNVVVLPVGKKPVPVHVPVSNTPVGAVGFDDSSQPASDISNAGTRMKWKHFLILGTAISERDLFDSATAPRAEISLFAALIRC